jgi:hypothetical protein
MKEQEVPQKADSIRRAYEGPCFQILPIWVTLGENRVIKKGKKRRKVKAGRTQETQGLRKDDEGG